MVAGVPIPRRATVVTEVDRRGAIAIGLAAAEPGDVVVIAGKGHETTQTVAGEQPAVRRPGGGPGAAGGRTVIALLIAGSVAMAASLLGARVLITFFRSRGKGQPILGPEDRGPEHQHKAGTPTMGGIAILGAALLGYLVAHLRKGAYFSDHAMFIMAGIAAMAALGFLDDFLKVRRAHNRGVLWKKKGWITLGMSFLIAALVVSFTEIDTRIGLTRADRPGWELGKVGWVLWAGLIIFSTVNAVNVTDGLDGLAAGSAILGFLAFTIIAFWGLRNPSLYPYIINPFDLSILAAALAGACVGFLWWNAAPARIIMGDVGALGLGRGARAPGPQHRHQPAAAVDLPAERHRDRLGGPPDGQLQAVQQAPDLPHVADPPPLRAHRLAGDDGGDPLLDHRRDRRGHRAGAVLRRLRPPHRGGLMDERARRVAPWSTGWPSRARPRSGRCEARGLDRHRGR